MADIFFKPSHEDLADERKKALKGTTEEECTEQANAILEFAQSNGYPEIKDAGETRVSSKHTTADQFAEWMKKNTK